MHPAMFVRGAQARFTDPETAEVVRPGSVDHRMGDVVAAAERAGFTVEGLDEFVADPALASRYPRAEKYLGCPMLVVVRLAPR
jgi:malonyl-CoA O-methyltransferase